MHGCSQGFGQDGAGRMDFPTWFRVGSIGGLILGILTAIGISAFTLGLRRGTRRQHARATLLCVIACAVSLAPIAWRQNRFDALGPTLSVYEIAFMLALAALAGWTVPLTLGLLYLLRAEPQPVTAAVPVPSTQRRVSNPSQPGSHDDLGRLIEPLGAGIAWGNLLPAIGIFADRTLALTRQTTLLGREVDCDIVVPDDRASRHHAELRWDHGVISLADLDSTNGTRVNGQRVIGQTPMRDGDVLAIGAHHYRLQLLKVESSEPTEILGEPSTLETTKVPGVSRPGGSRPSRTDPIILATDSGAARGKVWELCDQLSIIGRGAEYAVNLPDASVSRPHAQVVWQASGVFVQDLDSANGTHLNGVRLTAPARLQEGDLLLIGDVNLRCVALGAEAAAGSAPPDVSTLATTALNQVEPAAWAMPELHTRLAPRRADRPHLAPPRLMPSNDPHDPHGDT
jgi:pSer/pThr/pTyr-binding forkhead associated (FHA) protein